MAELFQWYFETSQTTWVTYVSDLIYYVMWFVLMDVTCKSRFKLWVTILAQFVVATIIFPTIAHLLPFMSVLRTVVLYVFLFSFCFVIFKDSKAKVALTLVLVQIIAVLNELVGGVLYFPEEVLAGRLDLISTRDLILRAYLPYEVLSGVCFLIVFVFLNRVKFSLKVRDCMRLTLYPLSQALLMGGWLEVLTIDRDRVAPWLFILLLVICVLADAALLLIIRDVSRRAQLEGENKLLEQQLEQQEKHYTALTEQYDSVRAMRHDISKHIDAVEALLSRGNQDEALHYLSELTETWKAVPVSYCQHPVADAFLSGRIGAAEELGIKTEFSGNIRPDIAVSSVDLIRSLGNLLDNAYESCKLSKGGSVSLKCLESAGCLVISTENPAEAHPVKRKKRISNLDRGIGTRVLAEIAEKYDGSFASGPIGGGSLYRATLILKV